MTTRDERVSELLAKLHAERGYTAHGCTVVEHGEVWSWIIGLIVDLEQRVEELEKGEPK